MTLYTSNSRTAQHYFCKYFLLLQALVFEVIGIMLLPIAQNFTKLLPTMWLGLCCFAVFYFISMIMNSLPVAVVYTSWSGLGVFLIAILGYFLFQQALHPAAILSIAFIVSREVMVNTYTQAHQYCY